MKRKVVLVKRNRSFEPFHGNTPSPWLVTRFVVRRQHFSSQQRWLWSTVRGRVNERIRRSNCQTIDRSPIPVTLRCVSQFRPGASWIPNGPAATPGRSRNTGWHRDPFPSPRNRRYNTQSHAAYAHFCSLTDSDEPIRPLRSLSESFLPTGTQDFHCSGTSIIIMLLHPRYDLDIWYNNVFLSFFSDNEIS